MDFQLTVEQCQWRERARAFACEQLAPGYQRRERQGHVERDVQESADVFAARVGVAGSRAQHAVVVLAV